MLALGEEFSLLKEDGIVVDRNFLAIHADWFKSGKHFSSWRPILERLLTQVGGYQDASKFRLIYEEFCEISNPLGDDCQTLDWHIARNSCLYLLAYKSFSIFGHGCEGICRADEWLFDLGSRFFRTERDVEDGGSVSVLDEISGWLEFMYRESIDIPTIELEVFVKQVLEKAIFISNAKIIAISSLLLFNHLESVRRVWEFILEAKGKSFMLDDLASLLMRAFDLLFREDVFEGICSSEVLELIRFILGSDSGITRKKGLYLLKRVLDVPSLKSDSELWNSFFVVFESLEDPQVHLMEPVFRMLTSIVGSDIGIAWWKLLLIRGLNCSHFSVRQTCIKILFDHVCDEQSEIEIEEGREFFFQELVNFLSEPQLYSKTIDFTDKLRDVYFKLLLNCSMVELNAQLLITSLNETFTSSLGIVSFFEALSQVSQVRDLNLSHSSCALIKHISCDAAFLLPSSRVYVRSLARQIITFGLNVHEIPFNDYIYLIGMTHCDKEGEKGLLELQVSSSEIESIQVAISGEKKEYFDNGHSNFVNSQLLDAEATLDAKWFALWTIYLKSKEGKKNLALALYPRLSNLYSQVYFQRTMAARNCALVLSYSLFLWNSDNRRGLLAYYIPSECESILNEVIPFFERTELDSVDFNYKIRFRALEAFLKFSPNNSLQVGEDDIYGIIQAMGNTDNLNQLIVELYLLHVRIQNYGLKSILLKEKLLSLLITENSKFRRCDHSIIMALQNVSLSLMLFLVKEGVDGKLVFEFCMDKLEGDYFEGGENLCMVWKLLKESCKSSKTEEVGQTISRLLKNVITPFLFKDGSKSLDFNLFQNCTLAIFEFLLCPELLANCHDAVLKFLHHVLVDCPRRCVLIQMTRVLLKSELFDPSWINLILDLICIDAKKEEFEQEYLVIKGNIINWLNYGACLSGPLKEAFCLGLFARSESICLRAKRGLFPNSSENHVLLRIWQFILLIFPNSLSELGSDFKRKIFDETIRSISMTTLSSVQSFQVWYLTLLLVNNMEEFMPLLIEEIENYWSHDSKVRPLVLNSYILTLYQVLNYSDACNFKISSSMLDHIMSLLLPLNMVKNFTSRVFSLMALSKLLKVLGSEHPQFLLVKRTVDLVVSSPEVKKTIERLERTELLFSNFNPVNDLDLETLFWHFVRSSVKNENLSTAEAFETVDFNSMERFFAFPDEGILIPRGREKHFNIGPIIAEPEITENDPDVINVNVQKKITTPWELMVEHNLFNNYRNSSSVLKTNSSFDVTVIASLLSKANNLGGLCRTCEVMGVRRLMLPGSPDVFLADNSFRALSMSSERWLPLQSLPKIDLIDFLRECKRIDPTLVIIALEQTTGSQPLHKFEFPNRFMLLLGNEKLGVPAPILDELVDVCVEIPQFGQVRSLNVHVSASIMLWEAKRQNLIRECKVQMKK